MSDGSNGIEDVSVKIVLRQVLLLAWRVLLNWKF